MAEYLSPGVYVEEVPSAVKAIAGVSTSVAAFIGIVPNTVNLVARNPSFNPATPGSPPSKVVAWNIPTPAGVVKEISNWTQFTKLFADMLGDETAQAVSGEGGAPAPVTDSFLRLAHAVFGFFNNGGSFCYVVRIATDSELPATLADLATIDNISLVCAPGDHIKAVRDQIIDHCENAQDRFAILDAPPSAPIDDLKTESKRPKRSDYAAWYYPWVQVFDPGTKLRDPQSDGVLHVPPSGHIAGLYARVDTERGVFKTPANEAIRGALGVSRRLSKAEQDQLNPSGVNCIRLLNGGVYVWGARTVGGDTNADLKYVSVRRTLTFLIESIEDGVSWAVFEPNTPALWGKITRNVTAFLTGAWRSGALFGATPQEAFFVKCDAETNPVAERELGRVVTEIGVAIVRPAEFVIFRISQVAPAAK